MSLTDIREQIAAILGAVDGVEIVHQYQRWAPTWEKFLGLFQDSDGRINGWCITRVKTPEPHSTTSHDARTYHFKIRGYYGLKDSEATELTFQDTIENICNEFRDKYQLNNTASDNSPIQVDTVDQRMFGNVLCHFCELSLTAGEYKAWS